MCSKNASSRSSSRWSLAARLTLWHSALAMALIAGVTAYSYFILTANFDREDGEYLNGKIEDVVLRLENASEPLESVKNDWSRFEDESAPLRILMRLLSQDGTTLATTPSASLVPWPPLNLDAQSPVAAEVSHWQIVSRRVMLGTGQSVVLQATMDRRQEYIFLSRYRKQLYLVLFFAATVSATGGYFLMKQGLRPLGELSSLAAGVGLHRMNERLEPEQYCVELAEVAGTFNAMLDRIEQWFERLNRFSGDIAHELRTPLHNLHSEIDVVLQKSRTMDEYRDALGSCLEEASRLSHLIDSLLFLARSESPQRVLKLETLHLRDELITIQEFYEAAADEAGIKLETCLGDLVIDADRTLFQRAIGNLVTNAIDHTAAGGTIVLSVEQHNNWIHVVVKDNGCGIAAVHLPHVYDRLYRASEARESQNFGLGLTIVKSVLELHQGAVNIQSEPGSGTTVITQWPLRRAHAD